MHCLKPQLVRIPTGHWYCPKCKSEGKSTGKKESKSNGTADSKQVVRRSSRLQRSPDNKEEDTELAANIEEESGENNKAHTTPRHSTRRASSMSDEAASDSRSKSTKETMQDNTKEKDADGVTTRKKSSISSSADSEIGEQGLIATRRSTRNVQKSRSEEGEVYEANKSEEKIDMNDNNENGSANEQLGYSLEKSSSIATPESESDETHSKRTPVRKVCNNPTLCNC
jgi:hypothetical protein